MGDPNNINLTEEYLQEERVPNSNLDEEEKQQTSVITGFGIIFQFPNHKLFQWLVLAKQTILPYAWLVFVGTCEFPREFPISPGLSLASKNFIIRD